MAEIVTLGIDPRAFGPKIKPPYPLPHVSRRALQRISDRIEIPSSCPHCDGAILLTNNRAVYDGRQFGKWPFVYMCKSCRAYVGLHPDTDLPLGTLADAYLREARQISKLMFTRLWQIHFGNRRLGYVWLSQRMKIKPTVCHFGMFDEDQCREALELCYNELMERDAYVPPTEGKV